MPSRCCFYIEIRIHIQRSASTCSQFVLLRIAASLWRRIIEMVVARFMKSVWSTFEKRAACFPTSWDEVAVAKRWLQGWHVPVQYFDQKDELLQCLRDSLRKLRSRCWMLLSLPDAVGEIGERCSRAPAYCAICFVALRSSCPVYVGFLCASELCGDTLTCYHILAKLVFCSIYCTRFHSSDCEFPS